MHETLVFCMPYVMDHVVYILDLDCNFIFGYKKLEYMYLDCWIYNRKWNEFMDIKGIL